MLLLCCFHSFARSDESHSSFRKLLLWGFLNCWWYFEPHSSLQKLMSCWCLFCQYHCPFDICWWVRCCWLIFRSLQDSMGQVNYCSSLLIGKHVPFLNCLVETTAKELDWKCSQLAQEAKRIHRSSPSPHWSESINQIMANSATSRSVGADEQKKYLNFQNRQRRETRRSELLTPDMNEILRGNERFFF